MGQSFFRTGNIGLNSWFSKCQLVMWAFIFAVILFASANSVYAISLSDHVITDDPKIGSVCIAPTPKTSFKTTDSKVYCWVLLSEASPQDQLLWKWIDPDNLVYVSVPWTSSDFGSICVASWMGISGQPAAKKAGSWKTELYVGNSLAATDTFTIGVQEQPSLPKVRFSPSETEPFMGGEMFDLVIHIESSTTPLVNSFSMFYNDVDITPTFFAWLDAGIILVAINGNLIDVTFPNISLPSGLHKISVIVGNPNGSTTANWTMDMTTPKYSLSAVQKDLINKNGNPDYLSILFNSDHQRREETWTYAALGKMYLFWDGVQVGEKSVGIDVNLYANPPLIDSSLFTDKTTLADIIKLFGSNYTVTDASIADPELADLNFKNFYFKDKGVLASFVGNQLAVVQTNDIPIIQTENMGGSFLKETGIVIPSLRVGLVDANRRLDPLNAFHPLQKVALATYLGACAVSHKIADLIEGSVFLCLSNSMYCQDFMSSFVAAIGKDNIIELATLGFVMMATTYKIIDEAQQACDADPPTNAAGITCPVECSSYTYSAWSECQPDGTQTRTVVSKSPEGCTGDPDPSLLSQSCEYSEPCTSYTFSEWSECRPNDTQTRTVVSKFPEGCTGDPDPSQLTQSCNYGQPCVAWDYSEWSECQSDGTQTREIILRYPEGCTGDGEVVRYCEYHPPCTSYVYFDSGCEPSGLYGTGLGAITRIYRGIPEGCVGNVPQTKYICCSLDPC
jgi:hypothetical protein